MSDTTPKKRFKTALQIILFIAIVGGGLLSARQFIDTSPKAKRSRPKKQIPVVEIQPVKSVSKTVVVNAMGTVISSRKISLNSELAGTVVWVSPNFVPGGKVKQGEALIRLDRIDYELAMKKQQSLVQQLQADLDLEKGQQEVARKEMMLMQKTLNKTIKDPNLALRVPQLNKVTASLRSQQIGLEQAQLNLERTTIKAPFNAMILDRTIELGSRITTQSPLASLTDTDTFWIEAAIPVEKLRWIHIPSANRPESSRATIHLQDGSKAAGQVIRLLGDLSNKSQMARLLVKIDDPLSTKSRVGQMPLLLNSYVSLDLSGSRIEDVVEIPRGAVKDGNQIWILEQNQLKIRTIDPVWEDADNLFVRKTIKPGELLIVSEMSTAVNGMALRALDNSTTSTKIADRRNSFPVNAHKRKPGDRKPRNGDRKQRDGDRRQSNDNRTATD